MADRFSPDAFCASAREFALSALEAHHAGNHRRVPIDAGTALEHLAKACLARRSPALLAELRSGSGVTSLIRLLGIDGAKVPARIRTIGLSEALTRAGLFVASKAVEGDLQTLIELRNGTVHAAEGAETGERILTAFVQQADALLADLGRAREDFWGGQLGVVEALLRDAGDKLAQRVKVKLAGAEAMLERQSASYGEAAIRALRTVSRSEPLTDAQRFYACPVCDCFGIAAGEHTVQWVPAGWDKKTGRAFELDGEVWFSARAFRCRLCGLRLDSEAEISAAGLDPEWKIEDADWRDYEPDTYDDGDAAYERWREGPG
jgi:hypothetical protein